MTLPALHITRLQLTRFRSYSALRLDLPAPEHPGKAQPVVLTGPNGAGKTNLLEAISWLVPGRGMRQTSAQEPRRKDEAEGWAVAAQASGLQGPVRLGTAEPEHGKTRRRISIDGEAARAQSQLGDHLAMVWQTPRMDGLFMDSAGTRRRFLDRLVAGFDPAHAGRVAAYETAMRSRLRVLKDGNGDAAWLSAIEAQMAEKGVAIAAARAALVAGLAGETHWRAEAFPRSRLTLAGFPDDALTGQPAVATEDEMARRLRAARPRDAASGSTGTGPHRSDLAVTHAPKDMPADQCSTGEQKLLLTGLVLAHARLVAATRGAVPILLLDEVAAHLDDIRRAALFDEITATGAQAFLTGTDAEIFTFNQHVTRGVVSEGRIEISVG